MKSEPRNRPLNPCLAMDGFARGDQVYRWSEHGVINSFVEPRPGWKRALVHWPGSDQFVDLSELHLVVAEQLRLL